MSQTQTGDATHLSEQDIYLFNEGTHSRLYEKLGAHYLGEGRGVQFAVWAPNASYVSVIGEFNEWDKSRHPMQKLEESGIWQLTIPECRPGLAYKYYVASEKYDFAADKVDPFGFMHSAPPARESVIWDLSYDWHDSHWLEKRSELQKHDCPMSIYEMHLGSWAKRKDDRPLTYRELAPCLADYLIDRGFTHVEFLPVMEHPFYGSWGYQTTGYFAPTSRYGTPQDLMYLIDYLHQRGIGVILDWVPSHFPTDAHGLAYFDGTHLYEHADLRQGFHPDWKSAIFNYGRHEVRSFLISSAMFWIDKYHADGLRVDAVASMLYLDYGRSQGEWVPNAFGGRENVDAIEMLRQMNRELYAAYPGVQTIAEESTSWPMVSRPVHIGGLGFGYKWDLGWMNDTLTYLKSDSIHRKYHHTELTFRGMYQYAENYVLPLSHDEVVHLKGSLIGRMPGDAWQKFANLRLLLMTQYAQPGKKLLFMGGEIGQWKEWNHDASLDWDLLEWPSHRGVQKLVDDLNRLYRSEPAMHEGDCEPFGHEWLNANDNEQSIISFLRKARDTEDVLLIAINYTPVPRYNYRIGVPRGGVWRELLNSDAEIYWGTGVGNLGEIEASPEPYLQWPNSVSLTLPPLGAVILKPVQR